MEQRPPGIEDDVVGERSAVEEVLLLPLLGGRAARAGPPVEHVVRVQQWRRVVEVLRQEIDRPFIRE